MDNFYFAVGDFGTWVRKIVLDTKAVKEMGERERN